MSSAAEKERRRKELELKRQKLADYQNKNKPKEPEIKENPKTVEDMDKTISELIGPTTRRTTENGSATDSATGSPSETRHSTASQSSSTSGTPSQNTPVSTHARRKPGNLSIQRVVGAEWDIPPKELEVYSKATQTTSTEDFPDIIPTTTHQSNKETMHAESSIHKKTHDEGTSAPAPQKKEQDATAPADLSIDEKEKILSSSDFASFFAKSSKLVERALYVAKEYDFAVDYSEADVDANARSDAIREVTLQTKLFDERWSKHRAVTDIGWSPKFPDLLVCSYSANEQGSNDPDGVVLVWSLHNALQRPEFRFHCQSPVVSAFFDEFSPTIVIGGTYSGQIVMWDTRARSSPVQHTPLSSIGHTHPVYSMKVVGSKNAHNLVSISTDGRLCVWSLENLLQPLEVLELHNKQSRPVTATAPVAVTALSFPDGEVNGFFVGSEEGAVYEAYRHGTKSGVYERYDGHHGPITGIDFHPGVGPINFSDLFITSSTDWTCKLWHKGIIKPLHSFEASDDYIYDVGWSPTNPAVFATVDGTGSMDLFHLNEEADVPVLKTPVSQRALNRLKWSADGKKIVTGDSAGAVYVYDVGDFANPQSDEWTVLEENVQKLIAAEQEIAALESQNQEKREI